MMSNKKQSSVFVFAIIPMVLMASTFQTKYRVTQQECCEEEIVKNVSNDNNVYHLINGINKTVYLNNNIFISDQITEPNTTYVIRNIYDLKGEELIVPQNCILKFKGGAILNGIIKGNNTIIVSRKRSALFKNVVFKGRFINKTAYSKWFKISSFNIFKSILLSFDGVLIINSSIAINDGALSRDELVIKKDLIQIEGDRKKVISIPPLLVEGNLVLNNIYFDFSNVIRKDINYAITCLQGSLEIKNCRLNGIPYGGIYSEYNNTSVLIDNNVLIGTYISGKEEKGLSNLNGIFVAKGGEVISITNNTLKRIQGCGIKFLELFARPKVFVNNNIIDYTRYGGIVLQSSCNPNVKVSNNKIKRVRQTSVFSGDSQSRVAENAAINLHGAPYAVIEGNYIEDCPCCAIDYEGSDMGARDELLKAKPKSTLSEQMYAYQSQGVGAKIINNIIDGKGVGAGITLDNVRGTLVKGNVIKNLKKYSVSVGALYMNRTTETVFQNNTIIDECPEDFPCIVIQCSSDAANSFGKIPCEGIKFLDNIITTYSSSVIEYWNNTSSEALNNTILVKNDESALDLSSKNLLEKKNKILHFSTNNLNRLFTIGELDEWSIKRISISANDKKAPPISMFLNIREKSGALKRVVIIDDSSIDIDTPFTVCPKIGASEGKVSLSVNSDYKSDTYRFDIIVELTPKSI